MNTRKATPQDLDAIEAIYDLIHTSEETGKSTIGWIRNVYPTRTTAENALLRDDLFVLEDSQVVAAAIINRQQVPEYALAPWQDIDAPDDQIMVLHTLVVSPLHSGKGYGKAFVSFYEQYALQHGCPYLRMDTNKINTTARKMYAHLGYREAGIVPCVFNGIEGVQLVCLEKKVHI